MNKRHILDKSKFIFWETVVVVAIIALFLLLYSGGMTEILSVIIGLLAAHVIKNVTLIFRYKHEDKSKLSEEDYTYDKKYLSDLTFCDKKTKLWYDSCVNDVKATYIIEDKNEFIYKLPTLVETNYTDLVGAHAASIIENKTMIRFDDYVYDREKNTATVKTSRTTFFNDLVTNRAVDYKIEGEISLRNIYEYGKTLKPLSESKFSNHIGINAMVFVGDVLLFDLRGSTGTISKNMLTSTLAFGVTEEEYVNEYSFEENIKERIVVNKLGERLKLSEEELETLLHSEKIKIYCMGFGRHIYMGGKPQFYYAVTIEEGSVTIDTAKEELKEIVDCSRCIIPVTRIELVKEDGYILRLTTTDGKKMKREAERSFFANYWHIISQQRIKGIPDWFYEGAKGKKHK